MDYLIIYRALAFVKGFLSDGIILTDICLLWQMDKNTPITAGVPQGGVWSPMLFNLYVHNFPSQLSS